MPASTRIHLLLLAIATSCAALALSWGWIARGDSAVPSAAAWLVLAAAYVCTEIFLLTFEHRRETHAVSFSAVPLVVGLFTMGPLAVVAARVAGSAIALVGYRRQAPIKVAINLSSFWLETAVAASVFGLLYDHHGMVGIDAGAPPHTWPAAFTAAVAGDLVQAVVVTIAISIYQRRVEVLAAPALFGPMASVINTGVAILCVTVLAAEPFALLLLAGVLSMVLASYRAHTRLREKHRQLEQVYDFTRTIGDAVLGGSLVPTLIEQLQELLHGEAAWLCVSQPDGRVARIRRDTDSAVSMSMPAASLDDRLHRAAHLAGHPLLVSAGDGNDLERMTAQLGFKQVLVAPLLRMSGAPASAIVADRSGEARRFGADDVQLFATLVNHACAALENGHLLDRLREQAAASEHESLHDALTGLPNRVLFANRLASTLETGEPSAVLLLDLDRFKEVNDTLGHHNGDVLLQAVAARLRSALRKGDTIARLGGDEFAILLPGAMREAAAAVARSVCVALEEPIELSGMAVTIGASVGIALAPTDGVDAAVLLQRADVAMYTAKGDQSGVELYEADRDHYSPDRLALAGELRRAIESHALEVHYQPQLDLTTGDVVGAEALVRWPGAPVGVTPAEVISLAEHTGLIAPLTDFVLEQAVGECGRWWRSGYRLRVSVNVSARTLGGKDLVRGVRAAIRGAGVPTEALCLEITESVIMNDVERTTSVLDDLAATGVTVAIDDFGTGYSSLGYLKHLPIGEIKIDKSFVLAMDRDEHDAAIVRSVIDLARNLELPVVAEGVESASAADTLRSLGCDLAQGFYFSRPIPADDFAAWLDAASASRSSSVAVG